MGVRVPHLIHVDVMDGHFVPNITIGPAVMKSLVRWTSMPFDVRLMISDPDRVHLHYFVTPQTEFITVHAEACTHLHRTLQSIRALGVKAGVALNPATSLSAVEYVADFGGSDFGHVGQSGVRRTVFHPFGAGKGTASGGSEEPRKAILSKSRSTEASVWEISRRFRLPAWISPWRAARYTASAEDVGQRVKELVARMG